MGRPSNIIVVSEDYRKLAEQFFTYQKAVGLYTQEQQSKVQLPERVFGVVGKARTVEHCPNPSP
ncbi:hypothetical protein [Algoriphagus sp. NBT04N3]|uniref:hypothetical protein n=1 Tax=Algoriphagus sp. NBT04N3 TaxID=2705473 RepID=UPI002102FCDF|nr:hypothetical protein [Algoriphagus sp. NBT04N3]